MTEVIEKVEDKDALITEGEKKTPEKDSKEKKFVQEPYQGGIMNLDAMEKEIAEDEKAREEALNPKKEVTPKKKEEEEEPTTGEEAVYKKRYGDARTHHNKYVEDSKQEVAELKRTISNLENTAIREIKLPSTEEEIEAFSIKYPDVFNVIKSIGIKENRESETRMNQRETDLQGRVDSLELATVRFDLKKLHPDLDEVVKADSFKSWIMVQDKYTQDVVQGRNVSSASGVLDRFKFETKWKMDKTPAVTQQKKKEAAAAETVSVKGGQAPSSEKDSDYDFKESDIAAMSSAQFEKNEAKINTAQRKGRILLDVPRPT